MTPSNPSRLRSTPQDDLELDPSVQDTSANADVGELGVGAASLFEQALEQTRMAITLVDPHQADSPIVYANRAFTELTGYAREEVVGRNCRFMQGPDTDPAAVEEIREAIASHEVRVIELLNYRRDGSTFWNSLHVGPVYDAKGELTHYYGSQWDVTDLVEKRSRIALQAEVAEELQHRTKNLFGVIASIVSLSARNVTDVPALVEKVRARIMALSEAHAISISEGRHTGQSSDLYDLIVAILAPYRTEADERIVLSGPMIRVPREAVTPVGLMLHELATNAVKYGALSNSAGTVTIAWKREGKRLRLTWTEIGGPPASAPETSGAGSRMMEGVLNAIGARMRNEWPPSGLVASLDMALDA